MFPSLRLQSAFPPYKRFATYAGIGAVRERKGIDMEKRLGKEIVNTEQ